MKYLKIVTPGFVVAALLLSGCSGSNDTPSAAKVTKDTTDAGPVVEHTHGAGPNGGVVFDLGSHHAEFTVEHGKHECTILVLGDDEKTPTAVAATELILNTKETKTAEGKIVSPMTITMSPQFATDGKATKFVGSDPGIGNVADFAGTVSGEIDGKPSIGDFKE